MNELKIEVFGELNMAVDALGRTGHKLEQLWDFGNCRLFPHDIELIETKIQELNEKLVRVEKYKNKFNRIANHRAKNYYNEAEKENGF